LPTEKSLTKRLQHTKNELDSESKEYYENQQQEKNIAVLHNDIYEKAVKKEFGENFNEKT
jgi:hypothetical protein